jgi:hypothetical protein
MGPAVFYESKCDLVCILKTVHLHDSKRGCRDILTLEISKLYNLLPIKVYADIKFLASKV